MKTIKSLLTLSIAIALICGCDSDYKDLERDEVENGNENENENENEEDIQEEVEGVRVQLVNAGTSTITVKWNVDGRSESEMATGDYDVRLYSASDCSDEDLYVSWILNDPDLWTVEEKTRVRFTFSGLEEDTPYWVVVCDRGDDSLVSEPFAVRTAVFGHSVTTTGEGTANVGDVLVAEDFSKLVLGGDVVFKAASINNTSSSYRSVWRVPKGENPVDELHMTPCNWDPEYNIYSDGNVTMEAIEAMGLQDWCMGDGTSCCTRPGYVKIGGKNAYGYFATPELTAIPEGKTATVRVDLECFPHYISLETSYCSSIQLAVINDVKLLDGKFCQAEGWTTTDDNAKFEDSAYVELIQHNNDFGDVAFDAYSVELKNVTNRSRIRFGPDLSFVSSHNRTRFELNSVVVTITDIQ